MFLKTFVNRSFEASSANVNLKSEIDKLDSRLQAEELKNQVLKQKLNDYEIQIELSNSKINALGGQIERKENEFKALKSKIDQLETAKDNTINKLTKSSNIRKIT
ncbi:hypothetical protein BpHYR1_005209 [Brachionus plicatilis]|uniref:Uncharacterized protein n=1 Tax=Brachionus plicatilis TaxID=10195 RepID=A0A3M7RNZ8_BRAPC|nr:hypothetical protein BpHYR1_005209 [Brachionus plicatilis]